MNDVADVALRCYPILYKRCIGRYSGVAGQINRVYPDIERVRAQNNPSMLGHRKYITNDFIHKNYYIGPTQELLHRQEQLTLFNLQLPPLPLK